MSRFIVFFSLMVVASSSAHAGTNELKSFWVDSSQVTVIDGDTMYAEGRIIQLTGIDAPEIGQKCDHNGHLWSCGMVAALDLHKLIAMNRIIKMHCWIAEKSSVWVTATCYVGEMDLAAALLGAGTVVPSRTASPHYLNLGGNAKDAGLGIWGSLFQLPSEWVEKSLSLKDKSECVFKAINYPSGLKYFASPLMPAYKKMEGTRLFCNDNKAILEGYHPLLTN